jgi:hypothetical protein
VFTAMIDPVNLLVPIKIKRIDRNTSGYRLLEDTGRDGFVFVLNLFRLGNVNRSD